jgi:glycosyltransferase involved in cell wall biosynthesis
MSSGQELQVLYVLFQDGGGIPHYTSELANGMAELADVSLAKPTETSADEFFSDEIETYELFKPIALSLPKLTSGEISPREVLSGFLSFRNLRKIRRIDPDIVHFTAELELFPPIKLLTKLTGLDRDQVVIETFHDVSTGQILGSGADFDEHEPLTDRLIYNVRDGVNRLIPEVDRSQGIVHTAVHRQRLLDRGMAPDQVSKIPHGTNELFRRIGTDADTEENTVLYFGNVVSSKGPDTLVQAVPYLVEEISDIRVVFAGDGNFSRRSRELIDEYDDNIEVHQEFIPNEEVATYFHRAQLAVVPHRRQKGHSGTLSIAYSFEKPVVTTTVGEFPELVRRPGTGLCVPPNDPEALASAAITILQNEEIRDVMCDNAAHMRHELSWKNVAERHLEVYEDVLSR